MSYQHTFNLDDVGKDIDAPMYSYISTIPGTAIWRKALVEVIMVVTSPTGTITLFRPMHEYMSPNFNRYDTQAEAIKAFMEQ